MAFDPTKPVNNGPILSAELRAQLTGLKELIDDRPTTSTVTTLIATNAASSITGVNTLNLTVNNPPTQAQVQTIVAKLNELITALGRMAS